MSNDDYKRGYRDGFKDGFSAGKDTTENPDKIIKIDPHGQPTAVPLPYIKPPHCSVCGVEFKGVVIGYVCPRLDCPSNVVW